MAFSPRLVLLPEAPAARGRAAADTLVLDVRDSVRPANEGAAGTPFEPCPAL